MLRIDADAHVLETEETWKYMKGPDEKFKPAIVGSVTGSGSGDQYWLVDGTLRLKSRNVGKDTPLESRELRDVATRLKHMDELKVDIQVIFPTIFIIPLTNRPEIELALCRSYNRWIADVTKDVRDRLTWAAVLPLSVMDEALKELLKHYNPELTYMSAAETSPLMSLQKMQIQENQGDLATPMSLLSIHASRIEALWARLQKKTQDTVIPYAFICVQQRFRHIGCAKETIVTEKVRLRDGREMEFCKL